MGAPAFECIFSTFRPKGWEGLELLLPLGQVVQIPERLHILHPPQIDHTPFTEGLAAQNARR